MSHLPLSPDPAHAVRPPVLTPSDPAFAEIIHALKTGPLIGFDMGATAVVGAAGVEGRVWIRADGRTHTLTTLDASLLALLIRLEPDLRGSDLFADAFIRASCEAERRVAGVHAWSGHIRPTEDVE